MGNNQENEKNAGNDPELERAQRSMGERIDADPKPEVVEEEPKAPEPEPKPAPEVKKDAIPDNENNPDMGDDGKGKKSPNRPDTYIPMPKYLTEKKEWETKFSTAEQRAKDAEAKVEELSRISSQSDGAKKDEDIEAFMAKTGFDRDVVEGLLGLAEKRLMKPELVEAINKAQVIVAEAELDTAFASEFQTDGVPSLKSSFPNITDAQLEKAKDFLDKVAHTKEFSTQTLDYVVYKHLDEIKSILGEESAPAPAQTKKTIEHSRPGNGKPSGLTAKDFEGQNDFSALNDMDPAVRSNLIKSFSDKTYQSFTRWAGNQNGGVEVTRNGQRVMLK